MSQTRKGVSAQRAQLTSWKALRKRIGSKFKRLAERRQQARHKTLTLTPRTKRSWQYAKQIKESWELLTETTLFLVRYRKFFIGMIILYALLTYFLVGGISQLDYAALKKQANTITNGLDVLSTAGAYFGAVMTGGLTQAPNSIQQLLSGVLSLIFWLAVVWSARMLMAGKEIKLRDAFYSGMTPLVSTLIVMLIIALQLIPAAIGLYALTVAITEYWIQTPLEAIVFGMATALLCLLSLYWLTGSIIGTAIVALPGMYPLNALGEAKVLATGRRWDIAMRVVVVIIMQVIGWGAILIPTFLLDRWLNIDWLPIVPLMVQLLGGLSVMYTSIYIYKMYRSLL